MSPSAPVSSTDHLMREGSVLGLGANSFHRIAYTEWLPAVPASTAAGGERVVLCLHGMTGNGRLFDDLALELVAHGYRVICPDLPGRGKSGWLSHKKDYCTRTYLNDLSALIARLNVPRLSVVGTSLGGLLGMLLASRVNSPVRFLVMNDVGPVVPWKVLWRVHQYASQDPFFETLDEAESFLRQVYRKVGEHTDEQWQRSTLHSVRRDGEGYRLAFDPMVPKQMPVAALLEWDRWKLWQLVTCPVLVLRGAQSDVLTTKILSRMITTGPQTDLVEFPGIGHAPSLMRPDQIAYVRDWLNRGHRL